MSARATIKPAQPGDRAPLRRQQTESLLDLAHDSEDRQRLRKWLLSDEDDYLARYLDDNCLLLARSRGSLVGSVALDLDRATVVGLSVKPDWRGLGIGQRLLEEVERLAVQFGMHRVFALVPPSAQAFFEYAHYRRKTGDVPADHRSMGIDTVRMRKDLSRRQTRFGREVAALHRRLGIPRDYGRRHRLKLQAECAELANIGTDVFGREQHLVPGAAMAWFDLRDAAAVDGVELQVVSAFRSVDYQAGIIRRKLERKQKMRDILSVSAAPGYSEHHTGRALDLGCENSPPLERHFEQTNAFEWLIQHAGKYGFRLSFPRDNRHRIAYEPWHWAWSG